MKAWFAMMRTDVAQAIKELSRLRYGRDVNEVEAELTKEPDFKYGFFQNPF